MVIQSESIFLLLINHSNSNPGFSNILRRKQESLHTWSLIWIMMMTIIIMIIVVVV